MQISAEIQDKIKSIIASGTTPGSFYLYDLRPMAHKIQRLKEVLPESVDIYYAMKANPHEAFLKTALDANASQEKAAEKKAAKDDASKSTDTEDSEKSSD